MLYRVSAWIKNLLKFKYLQNSFKTGNYKKLIKVLKSLFLILCVSHPFVWYVLFPTIDAVTKLVPPPCCNYKPVTWIQLMLQLIDCQWLAHLLSSNFLTKLLSIEQGKSLENYCPDNLGNWNIYFEGWSTVRGSPDYSVCYDTATWWWNEYDALYKKLHAWCYPCYIFTIKIMKTMSDDIAPWTDSQGNIRFVSGK